MDAEQSSLTVHMIGHGHIDPTWLWRWKEGYEEVRATFRSALDRMDETDAFIFSASSVCFYQWVKESDPVLFERIRTRVLEGRWEVVGGFWVEPDCNIPCGESFVRHGLYSQSFLAQEFGKHATVGFNPDSFGHAGTLPQILKKLGIVRYVYARPDPVVEMDYPEGDVFWWEAPDGSRVLAAHIPLGYGAGHRVSEKIRRMADYPHRVKGQHHMLCMYGVCNHGGGPTQEAIRAIQAFDSSRDNAAVTPVFSSLAGFFDAFQGELGEGDIPTIKNELQHHARGCYSAHSEVKRLNRQVEHALMNAERFATIAWLMGSQPYPHDAFEKCWKDLLYNQFHDILAGTSLESSYEDTRDQLGAARHRADVIANLAVQSIARDIDTSGAGNTMVAINPLPWPVTAPMCAPAIAQRELEAPMHIVSDNGEIVPSQAVQGERIDQVNHVFVAQLPAMGYRVFHARGGARQCKYTLPLDYGDRHMENFWWRIECDPRTGLLTRLFDKTRRIEVLKRGHVLAAMVDHSDTWSHGIDEYRVEAGRFSDAEISFVETGDVMVTLRIVSRYDKSTAITEYTLYREIDHIVCSMRVNWQQQYQALKLGFETRIEEGSTSYEAPYGYQERTPSGGEEPGQQWFDLTGTIDGCAYGLAILNDSKYSYDVRGNVMRMTLLRSPAYAHHDNGRFDASACRPIMDQGWQRIRLSLIPHPGDWRDAHVVKRAWELNAPPFVHMESAHSGGHALQAGLLGTESDNVLLSVIKCSEDGDDIIIRGYETAGRPATTRLHLPYFDKTFDLRFTPHEIKTLRINRSTWTIREVNLLEQ